MSIFIDTLAFPGDQLIVDEGKIAILLGSIAAACFGTFMLAVTGRKR